MTRIIDILELIVDEIKKDNPYHLVLKGGTALAFHHLARHRESEDLDFDIPRQYDSLNKQIVEFLMAILSRLKADGKIEDFKIRKEGFSSTDRYHMNIIIITHRAFQTKFDLSYTEMPDDLETEGELYFYTAQRMFVSKLLTFCSRQNLKDFFDIHHLLRKVEPDEFNNPIKIAELIDRVITQCERKALNNNFKLAMRNLDLRFTNLKERDLGSFVEKTIKELKAFRNELRRLNQSKS